MSSSVKYRLQSAKRARINNCSLAAANSNLSAFLLFLSLFVFSQESLSYRLFNSAYVFFILPLRSFFFHKVQYAFRDQYLGILNIPGILRYRLSVQHWTDKV